MGKKINTIEVTDDKINEINLGSDSFDEGQLFSVLLKEAGYKLIGILKNAEGVYDYSNEVYYSKLSKKIIIKFVDNDEYVVVKNTKHKNYLKKSFNII
jgi:hypothetical protein